MESRATKTLKVTLPPFPTNNISIRKKLFLARTVLGTVNHVPIIRHSTEANSLVQLRLKNSSYTRILRAGKDSVKMRFLLIHVETLNNVWRISHEQESTHSFFITFRLQIQFSLAYFLNVSLHKHLPVSVHT
jgi:hypothetical protein